MKKLKVWNEQSVYLFYRHSYGIKEQKCHYTLYKIDVDDDDYLESRPLRRLQGDSLNHIGDPMLDFKGPVRGMKCVRLGSRFYFLGGMKDVKPSPVEFPREVYCFDLLTHTHKKMEDSLNAGKPEPSVVFTVNGKLYALGSLPDVPWEDLHDMKLFECFDPSTSKWEALDNLPRVRKDWFRRPYPLGIEWLEFTVLPKRQQVVLIGMEYTSQVFGAAARVKFVYHLQKNEWTRHLLSEFGEFCLVEGDDDDYLYGISDVGPPLKTKSDNIRPLVANSLFNGGQVADVACLSIGRPLLEEDADAPRFSPWVLNFFYSPKHSYDLARSLHHLGNYRGDTLFCCIAAETLGDYKKNSAHTVTMTFFKEIKGEKQPSFEAQILDCKRFIIVPRGGGDLGATELIACFVIDYRELEKKLKKKKGKKKKKKNKKVQSISGTTSSI